MGWYLFSDPCENKYGGCFCYLCIVFMLAKSLILSLLALYFSELQYCFSIFYTVLQSFLDFIAIVIVSNHCSDAI